MLCFDDWNIDLRRWSKRCSPNEGKRLKKKWPLEVGLKALAKNIIFYSYNIFQYFQLQLASLKTDIKQHIKTYSSNNLKRLDFRFRNINYFVAFLPFPNILVTLFLLNNKSNLHSFLKLKLHKSFQLIDQGKNNKNELHKLPLWCFFQILNNT